MQYYKIVTYGDPILKRKAVPVTSVDEHIRRLAKDMLATMHRYGGVGLAAQQIGRQEAICVVDISVAEQARNAQASGMTCGVPMPMIMINPEITAAEGRIQMVEGCLSFPEIFIPLTRSAEVTVTFTDLKGRPQTVSAGGFLARAIQHEIDHLNGVLIVDRMSATQKLALSGKLRRLRSQTRAEASAAAMKS